MSYVYRRIFKSQLTGSSLIQELLQSMFVSEMLMSGSTAWIVSPWVSNVVILDNRSGNFDSLNPEWGRRQVRLSDALLSFLVHNRKVIIVTRKDEMNLKFLNEIQELADRHMLGGQLVTAVRDTLHTKGILLERSLLLGSMNLTFNGMQINDEWIEYSTNREDVARTRLEFQQYLASGS